IAAAITTRALTLWRWMTRRSPISRASARPSAWSGPTRNASCGPDGAHLPESGRLPAVGERPVPGAVGGVAERAALPRPGRPARRDGRRTRNDVAVAAPRWYHRPHSPDGRPLSRGDARGGRDAHPVHHPAASGALPPAVPVARAAEDAGHEVAVACA